MKPILILILSLRFILAFSQTPFPTKQLDDKLHALLKESNAPGFSIAIVKNSKLIYSKGFGYSNIEKKQKVDENTLFAIGSTSKAFTTGLLGILEAEHKLSFDDNPRKHLLKLEFYNSLLNSELTIKDLVSHRSGLPRHDFSWYLFPTDSKDSLLARVEYQEPFRDIRTQWYYNNFGYLIQGMITEKITGKSWEDNIRERFFTPLEMARSNVSIAEMKLMKNIATGYDWKNLETTEAMEYYNIAAMSPAGSINSSALEMSRWIEIWLNKGKYKEKQVLPEAYVKKAMNPLFLIGGGITDPQFPDQHLNSYGYAWFVSSYKGHYRLEHGGNIDGFSANVALFPTDNLGIVVLTNQNASILPTMARNIVSDLVLKTNETDWIAYMKEKLTGAKKKLSETKKKELEGSVNGTKPSHPLQDFAGDYNHPGYGTFHITVRDNSLFAQAPKEEFYLSHKHYDVFTPMKMKSGTVDKNSDAGFNFNFQTDEAGKIVSVALKLEPTLDPIQFKRVKTGNK
ncbi:serine hydrolase [Chryseobacterium kwangjuense]|uniref:Penicillin-binding protein n=1 Tax=Chryseobacterium kwangjuense TaxID=267125 RepID=A0A135WHB8_9FLAO|nr:serine hydrolase [Chryseobacterium kwangjuense]KXH84317.1 penicillin-binding protein [Chryseobacterium kwangjuense]